MDSDLFLDETNNVGNELFTSQGTDSQEFPSPRRPSSFFLRSTTNVEPRIHPAKLDVQEQLQKLKANMAQWRERQGSKRQSISWALFQATGGDIYSILPQQYR